MAHDGYPKKKKLARLTRTFVYLHLFKVFPMIWLPIQPQGTSLNTSTSGCVRKRESHLVTYCHYNSLYVHVCSPKVKNYVNISHFQTHRHIASNPKGIAGVLSSTMCDFEQHPTLRSLSDKQTFDFLPGAISRQEAHRVWQHEVLESR